MANDALLPGIVLGQLNLRLRTGSSGHRFVTKRAQFDAVFWNRQFVFVRVPLRRAVTNFTGDGFVAAG